MAFSNKLAQNSLEKCRTCLTPVVDIKLFHSLADRPQIGDLTLAEILFEVAKLKTTTALPQFICSTCRTCLVNAVDFVRKAQRANDSLLASLEETQNLDNKAIDCLVEIPIEWPDTEHGESMTSATAEMLEIKLEVKESSVDRDDSNNDDDISWHDSGEEWNNAYPTKEKNVADQSQHDKKVKYEDYITRNTNGQYVCNVCNKSYAWIQTLYRHIALHFDNPLFECRLCECTFRRRDKWQRHLRTKGHEQRRLESKTQTPSKKHSNTFLKDERIYNEEHTIREDDDNNEDETIAQSEVFRRVPRTRKSDEIVVKDATGRFVCTICQKTFAWLKNLQRHTKIHTSPTKYDCTECARSFLRKDKYTDHIRKHQNQKTTDVCTISQHDRRIVFLEQLYGMDTRPWCSRSCRLCNIQNFKTNAQLRVHLAQHQHDFSTIDELNFDSPLVQEHFWQLKTIDQIKMSIRTELLATKDCIPAKYYAIVNALGYEMDITDSDEENDNDTSSPRYECELCHLSFCRKHELLAHMHILHTADGTKWPYRCEICKTEFVCRPMFESHQRNYCQNPDRRYHCGECPGRFSWMNNLNEHDHSQLNVSEVKTTDIATIIRSFNGLRNKGRQLDIALCRPHGLKTIRCMICLSQHITINALRIHLQQHCKDITLTQLQQLEQQISTGSVQDISQIFYPEESPMILDQLRQRIMSDLSVGRTETLNRFYSIMNEFGNELHLDSSETENSDAGGDSDHNNHISAKPLKRSYRCEVCDSNAASFRRKHELLQHQLINHSPDAAPHVCVNCGLRFVCASVLEHHLTRLCHNPKRQHICRKCPQRFMWLDNLKAHTNIAHLTSANSEMISSSEKPPQFRCPECDSTFNMQKDLIRHRLSLHGSTPAFQCLWCPRRFHRMLNYQTHLQHHSIPANQLKAAEAHVLATSGPNGLKTIKCKVCDKDLCNISELRRHLKQQAMMPGGHGILPSEAQQNYSITNQYGLELSLDDSDTEEEDNDNVATDLKTILSYTCLLCSQRFQRKFQILLHQRSMHKHEELPFRCSEHCYFRTVCENLLHHHQRNQCTNQEKHYICDDCDIKFMWPENLARHKDLMHREESESIKDEVTIAPDAKQSNNFKKPRKKREEKPKSTEEVRKRKYLCSLCGLASNTSSNLAVHMRHHTGERPYKCDICGNAYARSSDMKAHRRTHTGERPHKCTVCEKGFTRSSKLFIHMRTHSGERPYKCTYCEKSFAQSNDLTLHTRRHTGERPYGCDVCGERFIQNTALKQHRLLKGHLAMDIPTS